jgi:hypothetical protein
MKKIPYFAIGNNELKEKKPIGKTVVCKNCGKRHKVEYGTSKKYDPITKQWSKPKPSKEMGFVTCGKKSFLVSIAGKEL